MGPRGTAQARARGLPRHRHLCVFSKLLGIQGQRGESIQTDKGKGSLKRVIGWQEVRKEGIRGLKGERDKIKGAGIGK